MKKIKYILEFLLFILLYPLLASIPYRVRLRIGGYLGLCVYYLYNKRKRIALKNIRKSFPEMSEDRHKNLCRESFRHFGTGIMESLQLEKLDTDFINKYISIEGEEYINKALSENKGLIAICPHLGNWEFIAAYTGLKKYPLSVVMKKQSNPFINKYIEKIRKSFNLELIDKKSAGFQILRSLKKNRAVAFVADQDAGRNGIFVNFLGRPASTAQGPARFALTYGSPVLICAGIREKDGRIKIIIEPVLKLVIDKKNKSGSIYRITEQWTEKIEDLIRKYPEQYFWMHRRWHTKIK